jgi:trimethylamine:corrinoid methyltransferase-like protein
VFNGVRFTKNSDIEQIVENSYLILEKIGVLVENEELVTLLKELLPEDINVKNGRVMIKRRLSEKVFISGGQTGTEDRVPTASSCAEIYEGQYLDPYDGQYKPWTQERLLSYFKLAKNLPNVGKASMLGCPLKEMNFIEKPLYEKLYSFKYDLGSNSSILNTDLCDPLLEIWQIYAQEKGKEISDVFRGGVYLLTPLKFGHVEADQLMWFYKRNLRVTVGTMATMGVSVPVTPAGAISEHIAEQIFCAMLDETLFGNSSFELAGMISVADIRNGTFQYGRPEQALLNNALSEIADYYHLAYHAHGGLTDSKAPSFEAGVQKMGTAMANIMKGRDGYFAAGLLSVDEVNSPVQMILDNEAVGYMKHLCRGFEVNEDNLAFDALDECIDENSMFIESWHTVENMRECIWIPQVFSAEMFNGWAQIKKLDLDRAREQAIALMEDEPELKSSISEDCEKRILDVIQKCKR